MSIRFGVSNDHVAITLSGKMHIDDTMILKERLLRYLEQGYLNFTVDVRKLRYIDISSLGVLVAVNKRALRGGGRLVLEGINGQVRETLELTQLIRMFEAS